MRSALIALTTLMLTGCGSPGQVQPSGETSAVANEALPSAPAPAGELEARVVRAMGQILREPASGRYSGLRSGTGGSICGTVNLGQRVGGDLGSRPFVITPAGAALLSASSRVDVADALDPFVDAHMRWCASPEELRAIQENMRNILAPATLAPPPGELPELSPEPVPSDPPTRWRNAPRAPPPNERVGDDDSFSNAVLRSDR